MRKSNFFTHFLLLILFGCFLSAAQAQRGIISGKVIDKVTGEELIGVSIQAVSKANGSLKGAISDFEGNFSFEVDSGLYNITVTYTSYAKFIVENYEAKAGTVNVLDVPLGAETTEIAEVVITAAVVRNTDASLIALQKRSFSIQDGISSQQIGRTGVANAADAMKQVTGAVVEGGKFIVMRGLGDRYSISQLNGITMPSTDPYRNSSSLDLIPSQMVENIITLKTFTPDLPGNFSGGLVNITTKTIPDKFNLYVSVSGSYNSQASFNDQFLGHGDDAGKNDWLGFDGGGRKIPDVLTVEANRLQLSQSSYLNARQPGEQFDPLRQLLLQSSRELSNVYIPKQKTAPINHGLNFSIGDNYKILGNSLGFNLGFNYSREFTHIENAAVNTFTNSGASLFDYQTLTETRSVETPHLGGLFNIAYKIGANNVISGNIIYNNDTDITGRQQSGSFPGVLSVPSATYVVNAMEFIRRQYVSYQIGGRHVLPQLNDIEITYNGSINNSLQEEPDTRYFAHSTYFDENNNEQRYEINEAEFRPPFHFWRDLEDKSSEAKIDLSIPFLRRGNAGSSNQIKFGGFYNKMTRSFSEYTFGLNRHPDIPVSLFPTSFQGDWDAFFDYQNYTILDTTFNSSGNVQRYRMGYHYINQINQRNFYDGDQEIFAGYLMAVYNVLPRLKVIAGARIETTDLSVVSQDTLLAPSNLDLTDVLYSVNLIYSLNDKSNIRLAASRTLARPNMRELAPFEQFDTKNGFFNIGNPNLKRTLISNFDLRYELYPQQGELFAASLFYKLFEDPILRRFSPTATLPELGYTNIDNAQVYGVELEFRKGLGFIGGEFWEKLSFNSNIAFIISEYDVPKDEVDASRGIDATYDVTTRPFQGQAPYIINAALSYIHLGKGWESTLSFNVSGRRLYNISLAAVPDVYEEPVPLLNFNLTKRFLDHWQVTFSARNILNPKARRTQEFRGDFLTSEEVRYGINLGLSLAYYIR